MARLQHGADNVPRRIFETARSSPDSPAVRDERGGLTYGELVGRAKRLASAIRQRCNARDAVVAIAAPHSADSIVAMLGAMFADAAYLVIEEGLPAARAEFMVADSRAVLLVTVDGGEGILAPGCCSGLPRLGLADAEHGLEEDDEPAPHPDQGAYLIYTSGSTGEPKGVLVPHRGLANLVAWYESYFGLTARDRGAQTASFAFDASVYEVWPTLCTGGELHIAPVRGRASVMATAGFFAERGVTHAFASTPLGESLLEWMATPEGVDWAGRAALRALTVAGDRLRSFAPRGCAFRIVNAYGPTENSVATTAGTVPADAAVDVSHPTIGRAIDGVQVYALDDDLAPVDAGQSGELWIAGASLARGYRGRPGLTAERFLPDPFSTAGRRMYRTGDHVRRRDDGEWEFLGRLDDQVKIAGVRIEPGEIESVLRGIEGVSNAVVVARPHRDANRLVAYCEGAPSLRPADLRRRLAEVLPAYMTPARLVVLPVFPINSAGKVDRRSLPDPASGRDDLDIPYVEPSNPLEAELALLFASVLGIEMVGVDDDFFALGGNSLLATRLLNQIASRTRVELELPDLFRAATVRKLASWANSAVTNGPAFALIERPARPPLAIQQEQVYFLHQFDARNTAYNAVAWLAMKGELDVVLLEQCLSLLIERHEIYRTEFVRGDEAPYQRVRAPWPVRLARQSLEHVPAERREGEVVAMLAAETARPFDLERLPLVRWTLVCLAADEHALLHVEHHLVHDGWSFNLLLRELTTLYAARSRGLKLQLPPLPMQFADYATWQRNWLRDPQADRQRAFWRERLHDSPPVLRLPFERPNARSLRPPSATLLETLPEDISSSLRALGESNGATLFAVLLSAFKVLLHRYTGVTDLIVGTGLANRTRAEFEPLLGMFVNVVALRSSLAADDGFEQVLRREAATVVEALANQELPFAEVVAALNPDRDLLNPPICQVAFSFHDSPLPTLELPGLALAVHEGSSLSCAKFDLNVIVIPRAQRRVTQRLMHDDTGLTFIWEYNSELYDEDSMRRMLRHYVRLLRSILAAPKSRVADLALLDAEERERTITRGRRPIATAHWHLMPERVHARALARPDQPALVGHRENLSYSELWRRIDGLARRLRASGVRPGDTVGVVATRSPDVVIAMMAAFNVGAVYLYLDPALPEARLQYLLADAGVVRLLVSEDYAGDGRLAGPHGMLPIAADAALDAGPLAPPQSLAPEAPAYMIYTSGSTGQPKAVVVSHRALANLVDWHIGRFAVGPDDHASQMASMSFDASMWEVCAALGAGATLYIAPDEIRGEATALIRFFADRRITIAFLPTPIGEIFLDRIATDTTSRLALRVLFVGGDRLRRFKPPGQRFELVNAYGPTENTVIATAGVVLPRMPDSPSRPSIGEPIDGVSAYVLDGELQPVPDAAIGELYLGGAGLAQGYHGKPAITAGRFLPDPFGGVPGARLYHTGDLVRRLPDGTIDFIGRVDGQVKVRGLRVELGEIEAVLRDHPAIADVVVRTRPGPDSEAQLVAWIVTTSKVGRRQAQAFVESRLPIHMMPARWVEIDKLPLTPNGKVDERALPAPGAAGVATTEAQPPRNGTERHLVELWKQLLAVPIEDLQASFFEVGGNSLQLMRLSLKLRSELGIEAELHELYRRPRLVEQAAYLDALRGATAAVAADASIRSTAPLSAGQKGLWFLQQLHPEASAYNIPLRVRIAGPLDLAALQRAFALLTMRHPMLRARFAVVDGEPRHEIEPTGPWLVVIDCSEEPEPEAAAEWLIDAEANRPFALVSGPPVAFRLYKLADERHQLLINVHHIVADGWSVGVLFRDLARFYRSSEPVSLAPDFRYFGYVDAQRRAAQGGSLPRQIEFWRERLSGAPREFNLSIARQRPWRQSFVGAEVALSLGPGLRERVEAVSRRRNETPYVFLLAAFYQALSSYSGQDDVLIGAAIAGRSRPALESVCGLFADLVVLRLDPGTDSTVRELLEAARRALLDGMAHQEAPFDDVVEALGWPRDPGRNPVVQVVFSFDREGLPTLDLHGAQTTVEPARLRTSKFDLALSIAPAGTDWQATLRYDTALFDAEDMARFLGHYRTIVSRLADAPDATSRHCLTTLEPSEAERVRQLGFGERRAALDRLVPDLLAEWIRTTPDRPALVDGESVLTYGELGAVSEAIAGFLVEKAVRRETVVAIASPRGLRSIAAIVGAMRAGASYLPLDPDVPPRRLLSILRDAGARVAFLSAAVAERLEGEGEPTDCIVVQLDRDWGEITKRRNGISLPAPLGPMISYLIYTSGSTGVPKGTAATQDSLANLYDYQRAYFGLASTDRCLQVIAPGFDVAVMEIWGTLASGATLYIPPARIEFDPPELVKFVDRHGITIINLATPLGEALLGWLDQHPDKTPVSLRILLVGGSALRRFAPKAPFTLINVYGPAEATVATTFDRVPTSPRPGERLPWLGRPLGNTGVYLLNPELELIPEGVPGEIYVGGAAVGRGYLGRPGPTAERFLPDPFAATPGGRMYRTGDAGRWAREGQLEFLGRRDRQIKINGVRIEVGEIEAQLLALEDVRDATAFLRRAPDGVDRLVAYLAVLDPSPESERRLRRSLEAELPRAMIPERFVLLDALPLTPNGKIDRDALPAPDWDNRPGALGARRIPSPGIEETIAGLWRNALGVNDIGADDDFFALGGNSLMAIKLLIQARASFQVDVSNVEFFRAPTVAHFAEMIQKGPALAPVTFEEIEL